MASILAQDKTIGPFVVGDQLPNLFVTLAWDSGGPVDLTTFPTASFVVSRLHGQSVVQEGDTGDAGIVYGDATQGELTVHWPAAFTEPGTYRFRLTLQDGSNPAKSQAVQRLVFSVVEDA